MSGDWTGIPYDAPGVLQAPIRFSAGAKKRWTISLPGKDLTGFTAKWFFGIPPNPELLNLGNVPYSPPKIILQKTSLDGSIAINVSSGSSLLLFTTVRADTQGLAPRGYWQQTIVYDPDGEPVPIEGGPLFLGPSLLSLDTP